MILIDFTQTIIAGLMAQLKHNDGEINEHMLRHMILNSCRNYQRRYGPDYGQIVLCTDAAKPWRRDFFPLYKANRKKSREADDKDWKLIFDTLHKVKMEIKENFPYKYMYVRECEADDIIAVLVKHAPEGEDILIVSGDKDFQQLHKYDNVKQWSPNLNKMIDCPDAKMFLKELNLKSKTEFYNYIKGMYKSKKEVSVNLPRAPRNYYLEKGWNGWADFLGKE